MKLGFEDVQARYVSGSQTARVSTERWVADWAYCPNCGNQNIKQLPPNLPVADFFCATCQEQYELKSQRKALGRRVMDGAYHKKIERLSSDTSPNLFLLRYNQQARQVVDLLVVPKHFFVADIIERRKLLAATAKRAGWVGSNILLERLPTAGRIFLVRGGEVEPKEQVLTTWQRTLFLRDASVEARGWLIEVMRCVEMIGRPTFTLDEVYAFEPRLSALYPRNNNVRPKIRQQLQVLRDSGFLEFVAKGTYRLLR
jgi:type II restriction enzyme